MRWARKRLLRRTRSNIPSKARAISSGPDVEDGAGHWRTSTMEKGRQ